MSPSAQKRLSAVGTGQANALASEDERTRLHSFGAIRPSSDGRAPERELRASDNDPKSASRPICVGTTPLRSLRLSCSAVSCVSCPIWVGRAPLKSLEDR